MKPYVAIRQYFIWVFTVCKSTCLQVSRMKGILKQTVQLMKLLIQLATVPCMGKHKRFGLLGDYYPLSSSRQKHISI